MGQFYPHFDEIKMSFSPLKIFSCFIGCVANFKID
jgi:hypothetical protein